MNAAIPISHETTRLHHIASHRKWTGKVVFGAALLLAAIGARPYAGSWNDGSRLASVESIVDRHTLALDDSIFVLDPAALARRRLTSPYDAPALRATGTKDKLLVGDHFYSDKPHVPALLMAAAYWILREGLGLKATANPRWFCYLMTLLSAGVAYALAVWSVFAISRAVGHADFPAMALAASLALGTAALPYSRNVNSHVMLLAVAGLILLNLEKIARCISPVRGRSFLIGSLAGLAYAIDPGAGMVLAVFACLAVTIMNRKAASLAPVLLAASPWIVAHHALNYSIGHTIAPANTVVAYLSWLGSGFDASNITGSLPNRSAWRTAVYSLALLFGKRGFVGHNLPLFMAIPAAVVLLADHGRLWQLEKWVVLCAASVCVATWAMYSLLSTNYSGLSCSIRWFVPMLAPAYLTMAIFLRERPQYWDPFVALSLFGAVLASMMWWQGPWNQHLVHGYWLLQACALITAGVQVFWLLESGSAWETPRERDP